MIIKFDTFPFSQFGVAEGVVEVVSPDSFTAQTEARNPTGDGFTPPGSASGIRSTVYPHHYRARWSSRCSSQISISYPACPSPPTSRWASGRSSNIFLVPLLPIPQEGMREP